MQITGKAFFDALYEYDKEVSARDNAAVKAEDRPTIEELGWLCTRWITSDDWVESMSRSDTKADLQPKVMARVYLFEGKAVQARLHAFENVEETFIHDHGRPFWSHDLAGLYIHKVSGFSLSPARLVAQHYDEASSAPVLAACCLAGAVQPCMPCERRCPPDTEYPGAPPDRLCHGAYLDTLSSVHPPTKRIIVHPPKQCSTVHPQCSVPQCIPDTVFHSAFHDTVLHSAIPDTRLPASVPAFPALPFYHIHSWHSILALYADMCLAFVCCGDL